MPAPDYADEYAACRARVTTLLADASEDVARTPVPTCPAWTVHDLTAHLAGVAASLVARDNPPPGDNQPWVDRHVSDRADRNLAEVLAEWNEVGPAFEQIMRKVPRAFGGLIYDVVAHEHDLRGALERPGARDSDGVWASLEMEIGIVRGDLAARGMPGTIELRAGDRVWVLGEGEPVVSLTAEPFELMRILGSRRSRRQVLDAGWQGDVEPFLDVLAHMPFPEHDIVE
jgi:uncharacterized protein (TIGR03083 family)